MIIDLFDNHHHHGNFYDLILTIVTVYSDEIFCMIWSSQDFVLKQYQGQIILPDFSSLSDYLEEENLCV